MSFDFLTDASPGVLQTITVPTNTVPSRLSHAVPLPFLGRWYLGVFNTDNHQVNYTIMATEAGQPTIITLTNGVPFHFHSRRPGWL